MKQNLFQRYPLIKHLLYMLAVSLVILFLVFLFIKIFARQGKEYELPDMRGQALAALEEENPLDLRFVVIDSLFTLMLAVEISILLKQIKKGPEYSEK